MYNSPIHFNGIALWSRKNRKNILKAIDKVIRKGIFLNGREAKNLEQNLLKILGKGYAITTSSGHDSLSLALQFLNLKREDEVIFPVNSYPTAFPVAQSEGTPIPVDVDMNGQINPEDLERKINKKTKAVVLVHLYGGVGDIEKILKIKREKRIFLIEDCAQSFGSRFKGKLTGTLGDIGCFSFYPTKNLLTLGDGGFIFTKDKKIYDFVKMAKSYGEGKRHQSLFVSGHSRMGEIQAAATNLYLKNIKKDFSIRKKLFRYYQKRIKENNIPIRILLSNRESDPVTHLFVIYGQRRDQLQRFLEKGGIETHIHFRTPIHLLPAFSYLGRKRGDFKTAEKLAKGVLSLPFHQYMSEKEINYIVNSIKDFYAKKGN